MDKKAKNIILVLGIILGLFFCIVVAVLLVLNSERAQSKNIQAKLEIAEESRRTAEDDINNMKGQIADLGSRLEDARSKITVYEKDLNGLKSSSTSLESQLKEKTDQLETLNNQSAALSQERDVLLEQLQKLEAEKAQAEVQKAAAAQAQAASQQQNAAPAAATGASEASPNEAPAKALEGEVLAINESHGFIVLNLGKEKGVKENDSFTIISGSTVIGKAVVQKVYESMSSASVSKDVNILNIKKGDKIVRE